MSLSPAPFHQLPECTESLPEAYWVSTDDNLRLRIALWRAKDAHATVLLFPGRTEYCEKYAPVAADLTRAGLNVLTIDWRGQGMADRMQDDPRPGHIEDFALYQLDAVAMIEAAAGLDLPDPWHLLAHSMGGTIGLAALLNGLPVASAAFSAPMWGINHAPMPRSIAMGLSNAAGRLKRGGRAALGTGGSGTYVMDEPFRNNLLTSDSDAWARLLREAAHWPELTLGGASYRWISQSLTECARLESLASPDLPVMVSLGSRERVISGPAIRKRVANWPDANLIEIEGGQHEVLFDTPPRRAQFLDAFLAQTGSGQAGSGPTGT